MRAVFCYADLFSGGGQAAFQQHLRQRRERPAAEGGVIRKDHPCGIIRVQRGPQGQGIALDAFAVGVAGADEVRPVVAHAARQIVMLAGEGAPALRQRLEEEP